jgi:hypothetical protein
MLALCGAAVAAPSPEVRAAETRPLLEPGSPTVYPERCDDGWQPNVLPATIGTGPSVQLRHGGVMPVMGLGTGAYGGPMDNCEMWTDRITEDAVATWINVGGARIDTSLNVRWIGGSNRDRRARPITASRTGCRRASAHRPLLFDAFAARTVHQPCGDRARGRGSRCA